MAQKLNSFEKFWKELKRRKVVHVITVYAAVAFVILQLVDIVGQPLRLPDWTTALIIVLLCIGFIIAIFVSWVYDITPTGVKKTKPASAVKHIDQTTTPVSSGWKVATITSIVVIVALVAFNIVTRRNLAEDRIGSDKSIAVLPFKSLSDDPNNQYLADGMMDAILLHLSKIKDLRVLPRTSVEQYRGTTKVAHDIGQELDVEYLLEGSFQKFGDNARLIVQLIRARKESHVWANEYNSKWSEVFSVQSGVAQTIAKELYASITPAEKGLIEKVPTSNMTAYNLYLKANDYQKEYQKTRDLSSYYTAVNLYKSALEIDSAYAKAYTGLAGAYYERYQSQIEAYFRENYLDSMLVLTKIALSFDNKLDEAFYLQGMYYMAKGNFKEALDNFDRALEINPNYYSAYYSKGYILANGSSDFVKVIDNYHKALDLIRGNERPSVLRNLAYVYMDIGFFEKVKYYLNEAFALDNNKAANIKYLSYLAFCQGNFEEGLNFERNLQEIDTTYASSTLMCLGDKEEAYSVARKMVEYYKKSDELNLQESHRVGFAFWQIGKREEAKNYLNQQIRYCEESIRLDRRLAKTFAAQYDLAATYAFLGERGKAYIYLDEINEGITLSLWMKPYMMYDPLFDSIRSEERFQKILQNMEAKYQAAHERVRKWLEEQGML
jgi:TolB-like protein/Flp pilus assembly protein TadD